jgi:hypothetical protein
MNDVNLLAVLVAIVASAALGALWYSPLMFLKAWTRARKREPVQNRSVYTITLVSAVGVALAFGWWAGPEPSVEEAVLDGLVVGMFFTGTTLGMHYAFAGRSVRLWLIDGGFEIARFVLIGLVFGLLG